MENQIMLIIGNLEISWFAVFTAIACIIGVCIACLLRHFQHKYISDIFTCVTFGIPLGLLFGRILYIVFSGSSLTGLLQYLNIANGGFGLYGVILGVFLGAVVAVRFFDADGLGSLLDCLAVGGAFAITVGRFATGFTPAEIGYEVDFKLFAVYDNAQGIYNLAIYQLDGIYEGIIFVICSWFFIKCVRSAKGEKIGGKTALLMLALHGTNTVVMDSMRADPLKLSVNEFIKISQIIGILCCVAVLVYLIVLTARKDKFGKFHWLSVPMIIVAIVLGVFGEWRVGSSNYISNHLIMLAGMLVLDWLTIEYALMSVGLSLRKSAVSENETVEEEQSASVASAVSAAPSEEDSDKNQKAPVKQPAQKQELPSNRSQSSATHPTAPEASQHSKEDQSIEAEAVAQAFIKTIPVISVNAPRIFPAVTNKATPVQPANATGTKADIVKPLGEQELNLSKIIAELDKADK